MSDKAKATYKIVRFQAENIKRLQAVEITPDGALIEITGANENGKSSLLDSIYYALGGTKDIPVAPIRSGQDTALVHLDLGTLRITRKFRRKDDGYTTTLVVENEDGAKYSSPQNILDALIGELAFDPLEFTRMKPKDQFDALRRFVADFDFDVNARDRKVAFDTRTDTSRDLKNLKSQVAGIAVPNDTPDQLVDVAGLTSELQQVGEFNAGIERNKGEARRLADDAVRARQDAAAHRTSAVDYRRLAEEADAEATRLDAAADDLDKKLNAAGDIPSLKDAAEVRGKIELANLVNAAVRDKQRRDGLIVEAEDLEKEVTRLTTEIERLDAAKATAISSSKMPVDGIGFAEDYITLDGLPFNQASSAKQLRTSIAIAIAANPRLRILIVRDGALLDGDAMKIVAEMAEKHDIQIWIETVDSKRPSAIVIEDGRVRDQALKVAAE